jgi:hypothetical protein
LSDDTEGPVASGAPRPDLYRTGNAQGPSPLRTAGRNADVTTDANGNVGRSSGGLSAFDRIADLTTAGRVWSLPADQPLPAGLGVVPSPPPPGHYLICPAAIMPLAHFQKLLGQLPWADTGQKRR